MGSRLELHEALCTMLGNNNVYFQPPESMKIKYPCIIYDLTSINTDNADDTKYTKHYRYSLTYIDKDPDNTKAEELLSLSYCSMDRVYKVDNLYHYVYTLFY